MIVPPGGSAAFLAGQPVAVLTRTELDILARYRDELTRLVALLPRLGVETLGEFAALPAAQAVGRLGPAGALAHRLARGLDPRPLAPAPPPCDESARQDFDPPVRLAEPLVYATEALAGMLHARLAARGLVCVRLRIEVHGADGRVSARTWRHDGMLSDLAVAERVRWQLDGWQSQGRQAAGWQPEDRRTGHHRADNRQMESRWTEDRWVGPRRADGQAESRRGGHAREGGTRAADSGTGAISGDCAVDEDSEDGGIVALRLVPDQLVRATGRQLGLWGDAVVSDRVARAALRVQAILGHSAVTRPVLAGGRDPADRVLFVPFGDVAEPVRPDDRPWPAGIPAPSPAAICPVPVPAEVTDADGEPVTVSGRAQLSAPPAALTLHVGTPRPGTPRPGTDRPGTPRPGTDRPGTAPVGTRQASTRQASTRQVGVPRAGALRADTLQAGVPQAGASQAGALRAGAARAITAWAGPWPVTERWWDPARARREARFQFVTEDGLACLAVLRDGCWFVAARYS